MQQSEVRVQSLPAEQQCGEAAGMITQDEWSAIRTLRERGIGNRAIARLLGISITTVRRYLRQGGRRRYRRAGPMSAQLERLGEALRRRAGEVDSCAQVLFQELRGQGFGGSYETVKRWMRPLRDAERWLNHHEPTAGLNRHFQLSRRWITFRDRKGSHSTTVDSHLPQFSLG